MATSRMRGLSSTVLAHPCYYPRVRLISRAPTTMARFDQLTSAEQLDRLTELALEDLYRILAVPLHVRPQSEWPMWLRAKVQAGQLVLAARLRVDEASLRQHEVDILPKLIEQIRQAKLENPALDL